MKRYLMQDLETLIKDIKLRIIGDLSAFEPELRELFQMRLPEQLAIQALIYPSPSITVVSKISSQL